jgi:ABC-type branched-subunit amino acid transport system substrate-binding protein
VPLAGGPEGPGAAGQRVAILLPLSGPRADIGQTMLHAAQLALDGPGAPPLDAKDTGGTPDGAAAAAQAAIAEGAGLILGPLTSQETAAVAPVARQANVAVLAFTNDPTQAQPGVWTLGITPAQQVRRLVAAAQAQGRSQFAALLPDTEFGHAMGQALIQATASSGLPPPNVQFHASGMQAINVAARELSDYANRRGPIDAQIRAARALGTPEGRRQAQELAKTPIAPPSFNTLLLADTGEALAEVAAVLPYYDVDRSAVQVMGPALWASPASGSGQMAGAWYAAPDPATRANFAQAFSAKYSSGASPLADLAYDAASLARVLAGRGFSAGALSQSSGYIGADGWFGLLPDGQVRRALAVFAIERGGPQMIEPAPQSGNVPGV